MDDQRCIVLAHGTSTAHLDAIRVGGLSATPPWKLSRLLCERTGGEPHLASLPGTYLASRLSSAAFYAEKAVEVFGGEPLIATVCAPVAALVPDEDEVHYQLNAALVDAFVADGAAPGRPAVPFTAAGLQRHTGELARGLRLRFELAPDARLAATARPLGALLTATLERAAGRAADEVFRDGAWTRPSWVAVLTQDAQGLACYRAHMDALCRALVGVAPDAYPCGWETCRGRVLDGIAIAGPGLPETAPRLVALGTLDDPTAHFAALDALGDAEILDPDLEPLLRSATSVLRR